MASMGPSRECDGDIAAAKEALAAQMLQWGRRVNATETHSGSAAACPPPCFNGAVA